MTVTEVQGPVSCLACGFWNATYNPLKFCAACGFQLALQSQVGLEMLDVSDAMASCERRRIAHALETIASVLERWDERGLPTRTVYA